MTKIYCDSSFHEACVVVEGNDPEIIPYRETVTVNEGEYLAVIAALMTAIKLGLTNVTIFSDSQLVVNQMNGVWKCRKLHLLKLRRIARDFQAVLGASLVWIPREENLAGKVLE